MWEEVVFIAGSVVLSIALIPTVFSDKKPAAATSIMTASVLFAFAAAQISLALYFAGASTVINGLLWTTILVQSLMAGRKENPDESSS